MDDAVKKSLCDILNSISNIELFCESRPREFQVFCDDVLFPQCCAMGACRDRGGYEQGAEGEA